MPQLQGVRKAKLPPRYKEGIAVSHVKAYVFDDTVILSGANLSTDYFTNRQDRYVVFRNTPDLASYFSSLVEQLVDNACWRQSVAHPTSPPAPPALMDRTTMTIATKDWQALLKPFLAADGRDGVAALKAAVRDSQRGAGGGNSAGAGHRAGAGDDAGTGISAGNDAGAGNNAGNDAAAGNGAGNDAGTGNTASVGDETGGGDGAGTRGGTGDGAFTVVFPSLQFAAVGVQQDFDATRHVLRHFAPRLHLHLASGYFNFPSTYKDVLASNPTLRTRHSMVDILTAAPQANGFWNAQRIASALPLAYSLLEESFYRQCARLGLGRAIKLHEFCRDGWTFHGKGLWLSPRRQEGEGAGDQTELGKPIVCMVGSPNFGRRSVDRDFEAQVTIVTTDPSLREALGDERDRLFRDSEPVTDAVFDRPERRLAGWSWRSGLWIHLGHRIVAPFL